MTDAGTANPAASVIDHHPKSDRWFFAGLAILSGLYVFLVLAMLAAAASHAFIGPDANPMVVSPDFAARHPVLARLTANPICAALADPNIQYSTKLTLLSCSITTIICLWVSVPVGYIMSRFNFRGKNLLDAVLDIPIVLPPLVVGLCLLILFSFPPFSWSADWVVFEIPGVILAQFMVACAFAVRTMRATFDQIPTRQEQVALTLGCSHGQAFWHVVVPQARRGMIAAATLAWARSLGEFGPILMFASATRMRTEVLSSTVYLEMQAGNLQAALGVSLIMIAFAVVVLVITRSIGLKGGVI